MFFRSSIQGQQSLCNRTSGTRIQLRHRWNMQSDTTLHSYTHTLAHSRSPHWVSFHHHLTQLKNCCRSRCQANKQATADAGCFMSASLPPARPDPLRPSQPVSQVLLAHLDNASTEASPFGPTYPHSSIPVQSNSIFSRPGLPISTIPRPINNRPQTQPKTTSGRRVLHTKKVVLQETVPQSHIPILLYVPRPVKTL
ncbi:hypothetical protein N657DRAFT_43590 [Parathielavia appendiculata]|uniref:Uncharacterized protein n=1 Tax=Parathielavia appendiculata TaxID=2587402 RepID=A0AAN6UC52_9PEZI|nr:hypothetical protein N657DRAFT_43590 [Parathielavia appendiculata]